MGTASSVHLASPYGSGRHLGGHVTDPLAIHYKLLAPEAGTSNPKTWERETLGPLSLVCSATFIISFCI